MKVAVVGSRDFQNFSQVRHYVRHLVAEGHEIVTGGARGVDSVAEWAAKTMGVGVIVYSPDWETHGRQAPFIRNQLIADAADKLVAFWDGESRGTLDTIRRAVKAGKTVVINPRLPQ